MTFLNFYNCPSSADKHCVREKEKETERERGRQTDREREKEREGERGERWTYGNVPDKAGKSDGIQ